MSVPRLVSGHFLCRDCGAKMTLSPSGTEFKRKGLTRCVDAQSIDGLAQASGVSYHALPALPRLCHIPPARWRDLLAARWSDAPSIGPNTLRLRVGPRTARHVAAAPCAGPGRNLRPPANRAAPDADLLGADPRGRSLRGVGFGPARQGQPGHLDAAVAGRSPAPRPCRPPTPRADPPTGCLR